MRALLTILFVFTALACFGQTPDNTSGVKRLIGFSFSPDYCFRTIRPTTDTAEIIVAKRDTEDIARFGYTIGQSLLYKPNSRFSFETGIQFSDKGEKTKKYDSLVALQPGDPLVPDEASFIYHYYYLDIPLKANYYVIDKKFKLFLSAGISANLYLGQKTISIRYYDDGRTIKRKTDGRSESFSPVNFAAIGGIGAEYPLSKQVIFRAEPVFRHSITSITHTSVKGYLYSYGCNFGLYYSFY